ncbi:relaxase/mobilization nuclease domain-containing protein [Bacillus pseudomycoides]|uniref:relaxase/mobilization nuclease domain-containing protein n=2 Tax=Bacillus cereus group TaxID=86661 RepID=UPI00032F0E19|nr:hypothetical protein [Bacillus pseudomycoides]EOP49070.1 hypothetical protein IIW_05324 [Bacillus cereus VD136]EOP63332.1 hypothetical protein KOW_05475 [Bacillus cereus VDM006]EOQ01295.1 hypothetical protein KOY_05516 [Bacillus cereus VDM021]PEL29450.1 hypothetical protein CN608_09835 [Bacillus pseudomycoides]
MTHVKSVGFEKHFGKNKPITAIKEHIKYIEADKDHHREKPELFNQNQDIIQRQDFMTKIREQPNRGVVAHKLVFTLSEDEYNKYNADLKDWTRQIINRFEIKTNQKLDWAATIHYDEGHPHVHVVIRGYNEANKQVGFYPKHLKELQQYAQEEISRTPQIELDLFIDRELTRQLQELKQERKLVTPEIEPIQVKQKSMKQQHLER